MTLITFADGKVRGRVIKDCGDDLGLFIGTDQACCNECQPCCPCSSASPPFVAESCGLQSVVLEFDLSLLGPCVGAATLEITSQDQDLGFAFSKQQTFATAGGNIIIQGNVWCENCCVVVQFLILPGTADGTECDFCDNFGAIGDSIRIAGTTGEDEICCPIGGSYQLGPAIPFCQNVDVQFSVNVTFVY